MSLKIKGKAEILTTKKACPICGQYYKMIQSNREAGITKYYHVWKTDANKAFYGSSVCTENWDFCPAPTIKKGD